MAILPGEKMLGAHVKEKLADDFSQQADERGYKVKRTLTAAARLWLELPPEIQARLLDKKLSGSAFIAIVRQIADEQIEKGRKAGRALVERQKQNKAPKG